MADERDNSLAWDILLCSIKHSKKFANSDVKNKTLVDYGEPNIETVASSVSWTVQQKLRFSKLALMLRRVTIFFNHSKHTL
jgi:hypothetical protein